MNMKIDSCFVDEMTEYAVSKINIAGKEETFTQRELTVEEMGLVNELARVSEMRMITDKNGQNASEMFFTMNMEKRNLYMVLFSLGGVERVGDETLKAKRKIGSEGWTLKDKTGKPIDINIDTVGRLRRQLFGILAKKANDINEIKEGQSKN